jgi:hypothetical protein
VTAATHWRSVGDGGKLLGPVKERGIPYCSPRAGHPKFCVGSQLAAERVDVFPRRGRDKEVDGNIGATTDGPRYIATVQRSFASWWPSILERRHAPMFEYI